MLHLESVFGDPWIEYLMEHLGGLFTIQRDDGGAAAYVYIGLDKIDVCGFDYGCAFMLACATGARCC